MLLAELPEEMTMLLAELPEEMTMLPAELPQEVVVEILIRLPVKSLLRFRCVAKPWKFLIDSPSFVKSHLSKNRNSKIYLFRDIQSHWIGRDGTTFNFTEVDLVNCSNLLHFQTLNLPEFCSYELTLMGSCDGLFCLATSLFSNFFLVNPSTREYKLLAPVSNRDELEGGFGAKGFGYDCSTDDYKAVVFTEGQTAVLVCGSKSYIWRKVDVSGKCKAYDCQGNGVYIHGALHWIADAREARFRIMAFDLANEEFTVTEYDKDLFGNPATVYLLAVGGRLFLYCRHNLKEGEEGFMDLWEMEEYGVRESWSKLISFDRNITPLAFSNCGRRLLFRVYRRWACSCSLHWYDLDKKSLEHFDTWRAADYYVCQQSLIRLQEKLPLDFFL